MGIAALLWRSTEVIKSIELEKAVGDEITAVIEIKNRMVATLKELGQAIK